MVIVGVDIDKDGANTNINNHNIVSNNNSDENSLNYFDKNNAITNNVDSESGGIGILIAMR